MKPKTPQTKHPKEDPKIDLGQKLNHYPTRRLGLKRWSAIIIGYLLIISAVLFSLIHFINTWQLVSIHGRAIVLNRISTPLTLLGLILPMGVLMIIFANFHSSDGITLYDKGLLENRGLKEHIWLWESTHRLDTRITKVKFGGSLIALKIKVLLENHQQGRYIIRNRFDSMDDLIYQIRLNVLPLLVKIAHRQLLRGETITFHKNLTATYPGLKINNGLLPWKELSKAQVEKDQLKLYKKNNPGEIFKSNIQGVKSLDLLLHLIKNPP